MCMDTQAALQYIHACAWTMRLHYNKYIHVHGHIICSTIPTCAWTQGRTTIHTYVHVHGHISLHCIHTCAKTIRTHYNTCTWTHKPHCNTYIHAYMCMDNKAALQYIHVHGYISRTTMHAYIHTCA